MSDPIAAVSFGTTVRAVMILAALVATACTSAIAVLAVIGQALLIAALPLFSA